MDLRDIERLQQELIDLQRPADLEMTVITLEAEETGRKPSDMVAVGFGVEPDGERTVQLRVRSSTGAVFQQAQELVEFAGDRGYRANLLVIEEARVPTKGEVKQSKPDPRMIDATRPMHLGVSVGHPEGSPGSVGALVYLDGKLSVLSASHVLARSGSAKPGDRVHRPGSGDIAALGPKTNFGTLEDFTLLTGNNANSIDAAVAVIDQGYNEKYHVIRPGHNVIPKDFVECPLRGQKLDKIEDARMIQLGSRVGKLGRTTGYKEGTVTAVALAHLAITNNSVLGTRISYTNLLEVTWDPKGSPNYPFSQPGDSGALVFTLDPPRAIAIHIIGAKRSDGVNLSYACHLQPALQHFNCELSPN
jgi:hypothetical protein